LESPEFAVLFLVQFSSFAEKLKQQPISNNSPSQTTAHLKLCISLLSPNPLPVTGQLSRCSDSLRDGRSGNRRSVRRDYLYLPRPAPGPTQPPMEFAPGIFPVGSIDGGVSSTNHSHLAPRLKKK
jgi:hypothetical protein